jgi:hypothetical protein
VSFLCWCSWVNIDEPFPYSTNRVICLLAISVATHVSIVGRMSKSEQESLGIMLAPCWSKITGMQFSCPCHFYPLHIPHFIAIIFILILRINGFLSPWLKVKPLFICCWHRINELLLHIRIWILQRNGLNDLVGYLFTQLDWYQLQLWISLHFIILESIQRCILCPRMQSKLLQNSNKFLFSCFYPCNVTCTSSYSSWWQLH